ncbi:hypothetical protein DDE18_12350 [Nocardioides gansuensis]|uniref:Uncharacterized protein n=1 Tax=Nocardioides gansuensis TaxID=2138300 RepID=A0A2T8F973_9ACTN|nr:hypothetical protein [Nocardioides gansuensis]PVG82281.1 hypothetical protein DDE18_12350 [Nocardioides gansuensis]
MSTVGTATRAAQAVVEGTVHAVRHPIESAAFVTGLAKGAAEGVLLRAHRDSSTQDTAEGSWVPPRPGERLTEVPKTTPVQPQPQTATEPKAPSRTAEHGGPGDDRFDDWREELDGGPDVETPVGTTGAGPGYNPDTGQTDLQQPDTEPLVDPSLTKAVKSESEILRKAADPDKG